MAITAPLARRLAAGLLLVLAAGCYTSEGSDDTGRAPPVVPDPDAVDPDPPAVDPDPSASGPELPAVPSSGTLVTSLNVGPWGVRGWRRGPTCTVAAPT